MLPEQQTILLVDDDEGMLQQYADELQNAGNFKIERALSGEKALELIKDNRLHFDFILMDNDLDEKNTSVWNGIESIKQIKQIDKETPIILFSGNAQDERLKFQAIEAGASACEIKQDADSTITLIQGIKEEMESIKRLSSEFSEFTDERKWLYETFTLDKEPDIAIIDYNYRILHINDKKKDNIENKPYPKYSLCYPSFNNFKAEKCPCKTCVVKTILEECKPWAEALFFTINRGKKQYLQIYAFPLEKAGQSLKSSKGKILAAVESAIELDDEAITNLSRDDRLFALLRRLWEEYQHVHFFIPGENSTLEVLWTDNRTDFKKGYSLLKDKYLKNYINKHENRIRNNGDTVDSEQYSSFFNINTIIKSFDKPFYHGDSFIGLLSLNNPEDGNQITDTTLEKYKPYFDEIEKILCKDYKQQNNENDVNNLNIRLYSSRTLYDSLKIITKEVKIKIGIDQVHIRILKDSKLILWPWLWSKLPIAIRNISKDKHYYYDTKVLETKEKYFIPDTQADSDFMRINALYPEKLKPIYNGMKSIAVYPVLQENKLLGVISFHSEKPFYFKEDDKKMNFLLDLFVTKTARILSDYKRWEELYEEKIKNETLIILSRSNISEKEIHIYLQEAALRIKEIFQADICSLYLWDNEWNLLRLEASTCLKENKPEVYKDYFYNLNDAACIMCSSFKNSTSFIGKWDNMSNVHKQNDFKQLYQGHLGGLPEERVLYPLSSAKHEGNKIKTALGMIEIIKNNTHDDSVNRKDDKINEKSILKQQDERLLEQLASLMTIVISNYKIKEELENFNIMQKLLLTFNQYYSKTKNMEEIYFLFLLSITHNEGLKHNRAFLILPDQQNAEELKIVAVTGLHSIKNKPDEWEKGFMSLQETLDYFETRGIPDGALWEKETLKIIPNFDCNTRFYNETIEKGVMVFDHQKLSIKDINELHRACPKTWRFKKSEKIPTQ